MLLRPCIQRRDQFSEDPYRAHLGSLPALVYLVERQKQGVEVDFQSAADGGDFE